MSELKNQIESLLFSSGKRLTAEDLGRLCKEENLDAVKAALILLQKELDDKSSSLMLVQEGETYKLTIREKYVSVVKKIVTTPELPKSILETLAVVAYKAPVLQSQVIKVRTNKAYRHLDELEEMGYITREKKGRSKLIKLTPKFFDYFDVPPEKLKDKFKNVTALEKAIEEKEELAQKTQQAIVDAAKEAQVIPITTELPKFAPEVEVIGDKVGDLETYGEAKPHKKHHKKKKKHEETAEEVEEAAEEIAKTREEAAEELAQKILAGESTEKKVEEKPEEEGITVKKIKREAAKQKRKKSTYEAKGVFAKGVPEEIKERIEHRVEEIVGSEMPPKIEAEPEETAEEAPAEEKPAEEASTEEKPAEKPSEEPEPEAPKEEVEEKPEEPAAEPEKTPEEAPAEPAEEPAETSEIRSIPERDQEPLVLDKPKKKRKKKEKKEKPVEEAPAKEESAEKPAAEPEKTPEEAPAEEPKPEKS